VIEPREERSQDCHFVSLTATRERESMEALERGKEGGSVRRIDMVASSMRYEAVISRARGEILSVKGEEGSDSDWEVDQVETEIRAADMTGGDI
jgi:hypothetical protein